MSNTRANSQPETDSKSQPASPDIEEPDPSGAILRNASPDQDDSSAPRDGAGVAVDVLWDGTVEAWQDRLGLSDDRMAEAVRAAAARRGFQRGQIGVRITDDATIHEINARHLSHDYPTDVISFPYSDDPDHIEGELVASVETAHENASEVGWEVANEMLLYVIHGVLHIGGMDDHEADERALMRDAEREVLARLGLQTPAVAEGDQRG
ncbi:rRNA maturation RNase YbeY [Stieleria sp. ICT_E10.1]|uniref:rRNA maturation RNase YbeY n=1 Tax=Stieleria sedimenti TaxID=2976331 RepID=UPI00217F4A5E|nr:rRNA maturation RNase YbeY [Stieleria sedimenti]MCS7467141.1 rRNA maturation RNase YbeY [Stieleria sedimenti]